MPSRTKIETVVCRISGKETPIEYVRVPGSGSGGEVEYKKLSRTCGEPCGGVCVTFEEAPERIKSN